jgi:hypothetical protein
MLPASGGGLFGGRGGVFQVTLRSPAPASSPAEQPQCSARNSRDCQRVATTRFLDLHRIFAYSVFVNLREPACYKEYKYLVLKTPTASDYPLQPPPLPRSEVTLFQQPSLLTLPRRQTDVLVT